MGFNMRGSLGETGLVLGLSKGGAAPFVTSEYRALVCVVGLTTCVFVFLVCFDLIFGGTVGGGGIANWEARRGSILNGSSFSWWVFPFD